jgi:hypothetical protein
MQILGAVCYVGPEAEGQQVLGLFTGTPAIAKWVTDGGVEVRQIIDYLTTMFK